MLDTDFNKLVDDKGDKEKRPLVFSQLHGIPKQIADSSNAIGVNERTLKNGLMSGVMQPSQIAHDRWLSVFDATFDSFVFFCFFYLVSVFGINLYVIGVLVVFYVYMFFHFFWWEHSMQWYFIETIRDYIKNTKNYYYATLIVTFILFTSVGFFYSIKYDFIGKINLLNQSLNNSSGISTLFHHKKHVVSPFEINTNEFETKKVEPVKDKVEEPITNVNKANNLIETSDVVQNFIIYNLLHIIIMLYIYKVSMNYYKNKRELNVQNSDSELISELEQKMFKLREDI